MLRTGFESPLGWLSVFVRVLVLSLILPQYLILLYNQYVML